MIKNLGDDVYSSPPEEFNANRAGQDFDVYGYGMGMTVL